MRWWKLAEWKESPVAVWGNEEGAVYAFPAGNPPKGERRRAVQRVRPAPVIPANDIPARWGGEDLAWYEFIQPGHRVEGQALWSRRGRWVVVWRRHLTI